MHTNGQRVRCRVQRLVRFATAHLLAPALNLVRSKATGALIEYTKILKRNQSLLRSTVVRAVEAI